MPARALSFRPLAAAAALSAAAALAGCASTKVDAEWRDPQFAQRSLVGQRVVVVCDAQDLAIRRICRDQLAARISALGATVVAPKNADQLTVGPPPANDATLAAAREASAAVILGASVAPEATVVSPGSSVGFSIGGISFGGRSATGGSVGIGMPIGGGQPSTAYAANLTLTDVSTVKVMWTSRVSARAHDNVNAQMADLARVGVDAARAAGFF